MVVILVHLTILAIPVISTGMAWTLTAAFHNILTFYLFHWSKGSPVPTIDSENMQMTQWEQIGDDDDFTISRLFLVILPVAGFFAAVE